MEDLEGVRELARARWSWHALVVVAAAALSSALIIGSYHSLSHTTDEPAHLAAGMEWLQFHRYTAQTENPPLSRIPLAVIPYVSGMRLKNDDAGATVSGVDMLYGSGDYLGNITRARVANLFFFWLLLGMTWVLSGGRKNPAVAIIATTVAATIPAIVAHSGLATTDVPFVVAFLLAVWRWKALLERPSLWNAAWLGCGVGIALATKFSTIPFLPPVVAALWFAYWRAGRLGPEWRSPAHLMRYSALALGVAALTIWASYGFRVATIGELPTSFGNYGRLPTTGWVRTVQNLPLPAAEFWHGLLYLRAHTIAGHRSYMLGRSSQRGFWLYYPVMLLVKTPLATLAFFLAGLPLVLSRRTQERPEFAGYALGAAGLLLIATTSPINLGIRHVLAIYPLLCMAAASGVARAAEGIGTRARTLWAAAGIVILLQVTVLAASFPRQLSYYNIVAAARPDYFISDSDFEWGQDVIAMEAYFHAHPVPELYLVPNGSALFCRHDLPPLKLLPVGREVNGWIAVFERPYQLNQGRVPKDLCGLPSAANTAIAPRGWLDWLHRRTPEAVIGSGVLLFHVTDAR